VLPLLEKEFGLMNWVDCERQPNNSILKKWDIEYGIDFVCQTSEKESLAFQVRNSKFDCFTIRSYSRGFKSETYKRLEQMGNKSYPFKSDVVWTVQTQVDESFKHVKQIFIVNTLELFKYLEAGGKRGEHCSVQDGNSFLSIAPKDLIASGIGVYIIEVQNG